MNSKKIKQVRVNAIDEYNFEEVPQAIIDIGFDNSDRKFIAVAIANNNSACIVQAADSKWVGWEGALKSEGIAVCFLCRKELEKIYERKTGK